LEGCTTGAALSCGNRTAREVRVGQSIWEDGGGGDRLDWLAGRRNRSLSTASSSSRKTVHSDLRNLLCTEWVYNRTCRYLPGYQGLASQSSPGSPRTGSGLRRMRSFGMVVTVLYAAICSPSLARQVGLVEHPWAKVYRHGL
jgi:hypothetical protein